MRHCPNCGCETKKDDLGKTFVCEMCNIRIVHEGNGFFTENF
jgi:DNA-directed RNA polymerase subunit RPC12/RpoP